MTTILVADDEPVLLWILAEALRDEGYEVLAARDGWEAVEMARGEAPDLFLMDIMMPRLDGREAVTRLRADDRLREKPVVLMSAAGNIVRIPDGVAFLAKPFDLERLLALIAHLLAPASSPADRPPAR